MSRPFPPCSLLLLLLMGASLAASAQSCTTATCNAASPSESDFLAALPSSSNSNATVVVNIPAGSASWNSGFSYTVPSGVTSLTIQGATAISWSGTAGSSSYSYNTSDSTVIQDAAQNNNSLMYFVINGNTKFRLTGFTIQGGNIGSSSNNKYNGVLYFTGSTPNLRMDHVHLNNTTYSPGTSSSWVRVTGSIVGVFDHNVLDLGTNMSVTNGFQAFQAYGDSIGMGDGTWANSSPWGTSHFLYFENNYFNGGAPDDCADGGAFVMRYNTINNAYVGIQTHATKSPGGPTRGCRAYEAYHNYFTGSTSAPSSGAGGSKGGSALVWGNTLAQGYYRFFQAATDRNSGDENETNTPNGWGYCGASVNSNGTGSQWDGNMSSSNGYPCLDGLGRGQTKQALNGAAFPNRLNSSTNSIAWPNQDLEPIYMWNNSIGSATYVLIQDPTTKNNQDYYYDCGAGNSTCSGGFTGSAGTGYGPQSSRPSSCSAGPGGTYFSSPTGSYGVAYFATDANGGNGELFVCTSSNTWTGIYQPYSYPHPLVSGTATTTATPASPKGLVASVLQ